MNETPRRRAGDKFFADTLEVLLEGDIRFAGTVLGMAMMVWGVLAAFVSPNDINWFAGDFVFRQTWFWFANHFFCGAFWIWCSVKRFPHPQSMLLGSWCVLMWTMIQVSRPSASYTSGMTLNFVVIFMGLMLIYRSGKQNVR
jgi:hypothetical protein